MKKMQKIIDFLEKKYGPKIKEHRWKDPFKVLIGCVLSQRTRDENTEKAVDNLFSAARTPKEMVKISLKKMEKLIRTSGMYRQKARRIKDICRILLKEYGSKVPRIREELMKLPGVGLKTSGVVMCYGYDKPLIPVDVHVEVCSKRLGLVPKNAKPKEIEERLEKLVPEDKRYLMNIGFVEFGKEICRTRNPKCDVCPIISLCAKDINP